MKKQEDDMTKPSMNTTGVTQTRRNRSAADPWHMRCWWPMAKRRFCWKTRDADIPLLEVRRERPVTTRPRHEQGTDRPGRRSDGPGAQRLRDGGDRLCRPGWRRSGFRSRACRDALPPGPCRPVSTGLIVVAPPRVLGALRQGHPLKRFAARVVAEVAPAILTNHPVDEIAARVSAATSARF